MISICPCPENKRAMLSFTFDDGTVDHLKIAAPELEKRNWSGTFFITSRSNDRPDSKWMTPGQIRELSGRGHEIAAHSMTHIHLQKKADAGNYGELAWEIAENIRILEGITGKKPVTYTAPFGENPPFIREVLRQHNLLNTPPRIRMGSLTTLGCLRENKNKFLEKDAFHVVMFHGVAPGFGGWDAPASFETFSMILDFFKELEEYFHIATFAENGYYRMRAENASLEEIAPNTFFLKLKPEAAAARGPVYLKLDSEKSVEIKVNGLPYLTETNGVFSALPGSVVEVEKN